MNNETARAGAVSDVRAVAALLSERYEDWRELRKTGEASRAYGEGVERIAKRAIETLYRAIGSLQKLPGKNVKIDERHQAISMSCNIKLQKV
jgi:ribosomal protein L20A (L18A)